MSKWTITLEITVDADNREDAIDKADLLVKNLPDGMIYDAEEKHE